MVEIHKTEITYITKNAINVFELNAKANYSFNMTSNGKMNSKEYQIFHNLG